MKKFNLREKRVFYPEGFFYHEKDVKEFLQECYKHTFTTEDGIGRPMHYIEIKQEFKELLRETQVLNGLENPKPSENGGARDAYEGIKPEDFIENAEKKARTHPPNDLEKPFPSKTSPVRNELDEVFK